MTTINTNYGILNDVDNVTFHTNGMVKDCVINEEVEFETPCGVLIPQHEFTSHRNKTGYSASFYETGILRKISLSDVTQVMTPSGLMPAELIMFYKSGKIKKVFPLNGKLSAYWEEDDEYQLAKESIFVLPFGEVKAKIIAITFYEDGAIRDLTFWPKEVIKIATPIGETAVRIGFSLYPDGNIKSIEPAYQSAIQTPIGEIKAFDMEASGISGDTNSLNFTQEGKIKSLITSINKVIISNDNGETSIYSPEQSIDIDGLEVAFVPLKITFEDNAVIFNDTETCDINHAQFKIEPYIKKAHSMCSDCASCGQSCGTTN
ncbi:MAG: hypothetical protein ACERKZ_12695 [Lachnotalea sp.]